MTASRDEPGRDDIVEVGGNACDSLRLWADFGANFLEKNGVSNARNNAEWILCDAAKCSRLQIYLGETGIAGPDVGRRYVSNLERRARREPLQYILESTEFMSLPFRIPRGVFVPRPDTEILVEEVEARLRAMPLSPCLRVLDLCCGSGVIAVSLARRVPNLEAWAVDSSRLAVDVTTMNATAHGVEDRIQIVNETAARFLNADVAENNGLFPPSYDFRPRFCAVVCNPPYIVSGDIPSLPPEVREHEPVEALDGGPDGLDFYRRAVPILPRWLEPGGFAAFEIGEAQGEAVSALMEETGFTGVNVKQDHAGRSRVVTGGRPA